MPRRIVESLRRECPSSPAEPVGRRSRCSRLRSAGAARRRRGRALAGIFGEREFIAALFPGYVGILKHAGFVPKSIDTAIEKRPTAGEPVGRHMNTDHIDVPPDFSDVRLAEMFLHHRVLIVPITDDGRVQASSPADFFQALVERFAAAGDGRPDA